MFDKDNVCHYTSWKKAISILRDKQINFNSLKSCDDPRESKQWNFDFLAGSAQRICLENYKKIPKEFDNYIKKNSMILCFCGWNNEEMDFTNNQIASFRQDFHRVGWTKSRMWSQYGVKHTGVCLVFDRKKLEKQLKSTFKKNKIFFGRVEYQYNLESFVRARKIECMNILKHGVGKALEMQIDKYYHEYFFLKLMDYRDEHEYRLVVIVDKGDSIGLPIESSLKGLMVGVNFPRRAYKHIDTLAQSCNSDMERYYLSWQQGQPQHWSLCERWKRKKST